MHSRFTKVLIVLALILVTVAGTCFATGQKGEAAPARPKMRMWLDSTFYVVATQGLLKSYALEWAQQKGVDLEYIQDSDKIMYPRIDAAIESKTLPDVLFLNLSWLPKMQRAKLTTDLSALAKELNANMGGFTKGVVAAVTTPEGMWMGIPYVSSSEEQYVRKDLLDAKGLAVPDTWDDIVKVARALNDPPNVWGWGHQVAPYDGERHNSAMILAYCGSVFSKDGKSITLDNPATRQVLAILKSAYEDGIIPKDAVTWDDAGNNNAYQSGKTAIAENTGSIATWAKANDIKLYNNTIYKLFPAGPAGRFIQADAWVMFVPNTSKYPEQAKDLIRALSQKNRQEELITEMGGFRVPVYIDLINLPVWKERHLKPLAESAPFIYYPGYPGPVTDLALEEFRQIVIAKMVLRVLTDKWTADKAIAEAVETIKRIQASLK